MVGICKTGDVTPEIENIVTNDVKFAFSDVICH